MRVVNIEASFDAVTVLGDDLVDKFKKDEFALKHFINEMLEGEFESVNTFEVYIDDGEQEEDE